MSVGSSGTTLYFMIGLAALADAPVTLTGQKYFQRRPVGPLLGALAQLGVRLESQDARPPITVQPSRPTGGHVRISGTLSQWISGLLLLAPFATRPTVVEVDGVLNEQPYVELTVRMMRDFGLEVGVSDDWRRFEIEPGQEATPTEIVLPPDIGSAAFGLAASALHPSDVLFRGMRTTLGTEIDHPEAHVLDVLTEMGLPMELRRGGRRGAGAARRHRAARRARRLPADARHAADPRDARVLRDRPDRVRERRARPPEGVRPRRLHAAAQPDGR